MGITNITSPCSWQTSTKSECLLADDAECGMTAEWTSSIFKCLGKMLISWCLRTSLLDLFYTGLLFLISWSSCHGNEKPIKLFCQRHVSLTWQKGTLLLSRCYVPTTSDWAARRKIKMHAILKCQYHTIMFPFCFLFPPNQICFVQHCRHLKVLCQRLMKKMTKLFCQQLKDKMLHYTPDLCEWRAGFRAQ